jgi:hypothetical protein
VAFFVPLLALAALILAIGASAGPVSTAAGFEGDDGNLAVNSTFDWNGFATTTWTGTAPTRTSTKTASGWLFVGKEDAHETTSDSAFAGGTKQDDNCPTVNTGKAPNKDDLKRIYLSTRVVSGDTYLALAWVRIPQNTTSASAHVGFEFNQGSTACTTGGLVNRVLGDMLIVYDFEGSSTDDPHITLRRWVTSGTCEVGNSSPPCWGTATDLTALGFAEAKVNTVPGPGAVPDQIGPSSETLGENEFGEAIINLTGAGVFGPNTCASFGKAFGVSRSSGNSGTAQMKDLIGPVDFQLQNCGSIKIIKQTDPRGLNRSFSFGTTNFGNAGASMSCAQDTNPADGFALNDTGNSGKTLGNTDPAQNSAGNTESCINILPGTYTVTEGADPTGFAFDSLTCTSSGGNTDSEASKTATITVAGGGSTVCLYINKQQLGAIEVTKTRKHAASGSGSHAHPGVTFTVNEIAGTSGATGSNGKICFANIPFGSYTVTETVPTGYAADGATTKAVTVNANGNCTSGAATVSFSNTPKTDITVSVNSQVDGGTASTISCNNGGPSGSTGANGDGSATATGLLPNTYTCTIVVDP